MFDWNTAVISACGITANYLMTGAEMRDEATAWVSLICTLVITCVTCIVQVVRTMRDINKDKSEGDKFEMPEDAYTDKTEQSEEDSGDDVNKQV